MHTSYEYSYDRSSKRLQPDPPTATTTIYERVHVDAAAVTATMTVAETADTAASEESGFCRRIIALGQGGTDITRDPYQ